MNPFKWIVTLPVRWYFEILIPRRKKKDEELMHKLFEALRYGEFQRHSWNQFPQRLRGKAEGQMRQWLEQKAKDAYPDLSTCIENVRECNVTVSEKEERRLYQVAMDNIHFGEQKLPFAKNLHGSPLPLRIVLEILAKTGESQGLMSYQWQEEVMQKFLAEVDRQPETIHAFLTVIAENGQYSHLSAACRLLKQPIPRNILRLCYERHLSQKDWNSWHATHMCIALKDWEEAERLILQLVDKKHTEQAGMLALAMHLAKKLEEKQQREKVDQPVA